MEIYLPLVKRNPEVEWPLTLVQQINEIGIDVSRVHWPFAHGHVEVAADPAISSAFKASRSRKLNISQELCLFLFSAKLKANTESSFSKGDSHILPAT